MKNKHIGYLVAIFTAILALVASCTKPEYPTPVSSSAALESSNVLLVNALPDDSLLDFAIDNVIVQAGVATGNYAGSPYSIINMGPQVIDARFASSSRSVGIGGGQTVVGAVFPYRTASSTSSVALSAANSTLTGSALDAAVATLELNNSAIFPNSYYTIIAQGKTGKRSRLLLVDNLTTPATGKANIRLVNAVPSGVTSAILDTATGTPPTAKVNGTVTGWTSIPIATKSYNAAASGVQSFTSVDATLSFKLYNGPVISTVSGVNTSATGIGSSFSLQSGGIYTILVVQKNGTVSSTIIQH